MLGNLFQPDDQRPAIPSPQELVDTLTHSMRNTIQETVTRYMTEELQATISAVITETLPATVAREIDRLSGKRKPVVRHEGITVLPSSLSPLNLKRRKVEQLPSSSSSDEEGSHNRGPAVQLPMDTGNNVKSSREDIKLPLENIDHKGLGLDSVSPSIEGTMLVPMNIVGACRPSEREYYNRFNTKPGGLDKWHAKAFARWYLKESVSITVQSWARNYLEMDQLQRQAAEQLKKQQRSPGSDCEEVEYSVLADGPAWMAPRTVAPDSHSTSIRSLWPQITPKEGDRFRGRRPL